MAMGQDPEMVQAIVEAATERLDGVVSGTVTLKKVRRCEAPRSSERSPRPTST